MLNDIRLFADLLPEEVYWSDSFNCLFWKNQKSVGGSIVNDTEFLELCHRIDKKLNIQTVNWRDKVNSYK